MGDVKYPGYTALLPPRIRYDKTMPSTAKLLYAEITAMTDVTGYCWASNKYLGRLVGVEETRVSRLIAQMVAAGYLELTDSGGKKRKIYVTDLGFLRLPPPVARQGNLVKKDKDNLVENDKDIHIEKSINNTPLNPPKGGASQKVRAQQHKARPDHCPEAFERLWKWYPTGELPRPAPRGNRQRAIRAWDRLQPSPELMDTIAAALARQAATEQWQQGVGIPHLSTYLNGYGWEGWEDDQ